MCKEDKNAPMTGRSEAPHRAGSPLHRNTTACSRIKEGCSEGELVREGVPYSDVKPVCLLAWPRVVVLRRVSCPDCSIPEIGRQRRIGWAIFKERGRGRRAKGTSHNVVGGGGQFDSQLPKKTGTDGAARPRATFRGRQVPNWTDCRYGRRAYKRPACVLPDALSTTMKGPMKRERRRGERKTVCMVGEGADREDET